MRYLVDTDWAVWWLRGRPEIVDRLKDLSRDGLALSTIGLAELVTGAQRSANPVSGERVLQQFLRRVAVLPFTAESGSTVWRRKRGATEIRSLNPSGHFPHEGIEDQKTYSFQRRE